MAESTGKTGRGISFWVADSGVSPTTYVKIANVAGITPSGKNAEEIDFTHLESDGGFRELRQGFKDPGSIGLNLHFDPTAASHQLLSALFLSGNLVDWRINYQGAGWEQWEVGRGFIQNPGDVDINVDGPITAAATMRVTGPTAFVSPT